MNFTGAIRSCLRQPFRFSGRASRPEFWWFVLFLFAGGMLCLFVDEALFETSTSRRSPVWDGFRVLLLLPTLAVAFRRLHDAGFPGWLILLPGGTLLAIAFAAFDVFRTLWTARGGTFEAGSFVGTYLTFVVWISTPLALVTLILMSWALVLASEPGPNRYGPPPA